MGIIPAAAHRPPTSLLALLTLLIALAGCTMRSANPNVAPEAEAPPPPAKALGAFTPVRGTDYLVAPIVRDAAARETSGFSFSSPGYTPATTHNLVFLNQRDETIRLLLSANDQVILYQRTFPEPREEEEAPPPVAWLLYGVVAADTNGDGQLDREDHQTLAISDAGGIGYTEVLADVEEILGTTLRDPNTLLVIVRQGGAYQLARIDLPGRALANLTPFPPLGPDVQ